MRRVAHVVFVLALTAPSAALALDPPAIPIGAWYTSSRTDADYVRSVAKNLKEHHFNTVVANDAFTSEMVDLFAEQGLAVVTRGDKFLDHPAVIASVVGADPRPEARAGEDIEKLNQQYEALRAKTDKPLITCLFGDSLGVDYSNGQWDFWKTVKPKLRCLRWYGISRGHYGVLHRRLYLGYVSYGAVVRLASSGKGPFWIVLPGFGKDDPDADHQNPTPAQMRAMMHLALAYGARGLLFWSLQNYGDWQCLAEEGSLKPTDGKYAAAAQVADKIQANIEVFRSMRRGGGDLRCPSSYVDAVGQYGPRGRFYMYLVNKNTKASVSSRLLWWGQRPLLTMARDVLNNADLELSKELNEEGYQVVPFELGPGEGKLIDFGGGRPQDKTEDEAEALVAADTEEAKARQRKKKETLAHLLQREVPRGQWTTLTRKLLEPWFGKSAKWGQALLGGKVLMDGAAVYEGGGKLIGTYESEVGTFASWYASPEAGGASAVKSVFATCGIARQPRTMAVLTLDVIPRDAEEHTFEVRLPMAPGLECVRRVACNLSPARLKSLEGNAHGANKLYMHHFKYFEVYPRGQANYCADTVLRPAAKNAAGWLVSRVIEPRRGPVFPAEYRAPQTPGKEDASLALSGQSKAFRLKLLLFPEKAPADQEPQVFTVPIADNELQLASTWYLKFRLENYGRTVFTLTSPERTLAVGTDDHKTVEDEMMKLD